MKSTVMNITDAHLDLAYNALRGRDVTRAAVAQLAHEEGIPTVGLPDLRAGGVNLICATIFCSPATEGAAGYHTTDEAFAMADAQLAWYEQQHHAGELRIVRSAREIVTGDAPTTVSSSRAIPAILLLEGADPVRNLGDVQRFYDRGVRIVGLAWKRTRYAGGTASPGPLTPEGVSLVRELDRAKIIHDASHLAEESFWQLMELSRGPVIASHSNCRSIITPDPKARQLSDAMIQAILARDGVIGINFFDRFLIPPSEHGQRRATLTDVVRHIQHICDLAGNADHVAIGTDMDGGLGRNEIPEEIETSRDLTKLIDVLAEAGFSARDVAKIMGENWRRFFASHLHGGREVTLR